MHEGPMNRAERSCAARFGNAMVGVVLLATLSIGLCGCDLQPCSGFHPGDALDLILGEISNASGASSQCDSRLGITKGSRLRIRVSEAEPNDCGKVIGPIVEVDTEFETEFDEEVSRALAVHRGMVWVNETKMSSSDCTGILNLELQSLEPVPLVDSANAKLVVGYSVGPGGPSCPASCNAVHSVAITRAAED